VRDRAASDSANVRFDSFDVNLRTGDVHRNGVPVVLQEQPLRILIRLLEARGEIVTREALRSELWPGNTFIDFEHSLNAAIKRLRDALGDSADSPRFVETVPRRGYRFIAPTSPVSDGTARPRRLPVAIAAAVAIAALLPWLVSLRLGPVRARACR